jgi:hypothetical protein
MSVLNWLRGVLRRIVPRTRPLCDTCKYDYPSACRRPERPNAMQCPDYKRR